jgi:hypothetical protein
MRLHVVIGDRRMVIPVKDGMKVEELLGETWRRTGLSKDDGDRVITEAGFELYPADDV